MTAVTLQDFTLNAGQYLAATAADDVVVTQDGEPWVVLRAVEDDQDRLSAAYANSADFHELIEQRRKEECMTWEDAKKQLDLGQ